MLQNYFRIRFTANNLEPFTYQGSDGVCITEYKRAVEMADFLCDWDLGFKNKEDIKSTNVKPLIDAYRTYRQKHGINHPELVASSTCTIDQYDGRDWWIVSENFLETPDFSMGEQDAFDTSDNAWERYSHIEDMLTDMIFNPTKYEDMLDNGFM